MGETLVMRETEMACPFCGGRMHKAGFNYTKDGAVQRWRCKSCFRHTVKPKMTNKNDGGV